MDVLLWLIPIPIAAAAAVAWGAWSSRTRRPDEAYDTVAAHDRFRAALSQPSRPATPQSGHSQVAPAQPAPQEEKGTPADEAPRSE